MIDFYISDTHFSHDNILKFEGVARPFASIEEHDEELIKRWNDRVGPNDKILHLGDVCFKPATSMDRILPRLNGKKHLIMGNHDTSPTDRYLKYFKIFPVVTTKDSGLIFSHYPLHDSQLGYRYSVNVHGHCHSKSLPDKRYVNISCEHTNLAPISRDELMKLVKGTTD